LVQYSLTKCHEMTQRVHLAEKDRSISKASKGMHRLGADHHSTHVQDVLMRK